VDIKATILDLADYARRKAGETNDQATLDALDKASALPDPQRLGALRRASSKWAMTASDLPYTKMLDEFRGSPANGDAADWVAGVHFSGSTIGSSLTAMDLRALGLEMPIPFFIVQGRDDHLTGLEPARAYVEDIRAPKKELVAIDGGHYACFTNPGEFVPALRKLVKPLV
jgi:pimeloyl-ACP methyl ester carboxylesterase